MVDQYDDWGNPIKRYQPPDRSVKGTLRAYFHLLTRRYRNHFTTIICLICLIAYFNIPGQAKLPPTDWSQFAYVQYVTDDHNMCNAYMVFEALHRHGSRAERVLLYPKEWDLRDIDPKNRNSQLLVRAQKLYKVVLKPISVINTDGKTQPGTSGSPSTWDTSITKLRAFQLGEYERVLHLDSDITLLQNLDELFLLPSAPIAMPRAYWSDEPPGRWPLTSLLMLIEPNPAEFDNFIDILMSWKMKPGFQVGRNYDMDLINHRFGSSAMVLPHRQYAMLTAEFRRENHAPYLGTVNGPRIRHSKYNWDADRALEEAKLVHFSDWPLPKPWIMWPPDGLAAIQPQCEGGTSTCHERTIWKNLYSDFRKRRKDLCRLLSVPAPRWEDIRNGTEGEPT